MWSGDRMTPDLPKVMRWLVLMTEVDQKPRAGMSRAALVLNSDADSSLLASLFSAAFLSWAIRLALTSCSMSSSLLQPSWGSTPMPTSSSFRLSGFIREATFLQCFSSNG